MLVRIPRPWEMPESLATPEHVFLNRRHFLQAAGLAAGAALVPTGLLAAVERNPKYTLDRPITAEMFSTRYNNFYEFTERKEQVWRMVDKYQTRPWKIDIAGAVEKPFSLDIDELLKKMPIEERLYRLRCVERWAMAVPWTGFPFKALVDLAKPLAKANYVRMLSFYKPDQAPGQASATWYKWPYYEGLTLAEATTDLAFLVTGMYGKDLPKQNGAPLRLAVPWKYGFKSIKGIVRFEFTEKQPPTFWNDAAAAEYDFWATVNPKVPHPRWSQAEETMIGTNERRNTILYNGYGEFVSHLYTKK